jgi:hypothetical protein
MIDNFSTRARQITFAARFKAGERGAKMIDIDDFLVSMVLEDQGLLVKSVSRRFLRDKALSSIWFSLTGRSFRRELSKTCWST